jgi:hypothetical protein
MLEEHGMGAPTPRGSPPSVDATGPRSGWRQTWRHRPCPPEQGRHGEEPEAPGDVAGEVGERGGVQPERDEYAGGDEAGRGVPDRTIARGATARVTVPATSTVKAAVSA